MPTSHLYQLNEIAELIKRISPQIVLDVGVGFGKYGFLSREYLDVWNERILKKDWETRIEGIEVFQNHISPIHEFIYDRIFIGNALDVLSELKTKYDLVLLIDVIEHFEFEEGMVVLKKCQEIGKNVIVSTPKDIKAHAESHGSPFEIHRSQWGKRHFSEFPNRFFVSNTKSFICCFGRDASKIRYKVKFRKLISEIRNLFEETGNLLLGR